MKLNKIITWVAVGIMLYVVLTFWLYYRKVKFEKTQTRGTIEKKLKHLRNRLQNCPDPEPPHVVIDTTGLSELRLQVIKSQAAYDSLVVNFQEYREGKEKIISRYEKRFAELDSFSDDDAVRYFLVWTGFSTD